MDRVNSRISQAYGYAVCLITVIVMLIGIKQVVDAAFDLSDPIRADGGGYGRMGRPITNFELYKMEARRQGPTRSSTAVPGERASTDSTTSDADLRRMYDAERETAIGNTRFRAIKSLAGNLLLLVAAGVLFTIHWRWLKMRDSAPATGGIS
jgi:hypothetical protein